MQQWKRPLGCLLLCVLLLGLCPGAGAAADGSDIIFLALNDTMPYALSSATMPYWSGSVLYVHSTTFDITSLNLSASYNAGNMTLLLYSGASKRSLTFYLADGYVQTQAGVTEEITAAMRGDQVFLFDPYYQAEPFGDPALQMVAGHPAEYNRIVPVRCMERAERDVYALGPAEGREAVILFNDETVLTADKTVEYII